MKDIVTNIGTKENNDAKEIMENTIDIAELGAKIGMEPKEQTLPNGKVVNSLVWDSENLIKAVEAVKHLSSEGKPVRITGQAPAWLVSALAHTVHPCPVGVYMPTIAFSLWLLNPYFSNNLSKVVVPEISAGKAVYLSGRGPNYLTVAIAEAYAHTNSSVSLFQPGVGYTCSITHSRDKKLGELTKDPMGIEKIKEEIVQSKINTNDDIIKKI